MAVEQEVPIDTRRRRIIIDRQESLVRDATGVAQDFCRNPAYALQLTFGFTEIQMALLRGYFARDLIGKTTEPIADIFPFLRKKIDPIDDEIAHSKALEQQDTTINKLISTYQGMTRNEAVAALTDSPYSIHRETQFIIAQGNDAIEKKTRELLAEHGLPEDIARTSHLLSSAYLHPEPIEQERTQRILLARDLAKQTYFTHSKTH